MIEPGQERIRRNTLERCTAFGAPSKPAIVQAILDTTVAPVTVRLKNIEPDRSSAAYPPSDSTLIGVHR